MLPVIKGAKLGLSECRWQFRNHHWNCSVLPYKTEETISMLISTTDLPPQSRVLRENKNGNNNNNPSKKRKARNQRNGTDNLNLGGKEFYASESSPKSKKKNKKSNPVVLDGTSTNNFVMGGGMTKSPSRRRVQTEQNQDQEQSVLHLHHHDKEEKANWDSILTRGDQHFYLF